MPWLTVRENVELVIHDARRERPWVDHLLNKVGLYQRADAFPGQLSGGMQRRVALARAMAIKPDILLLDEPFSSLDVPTAASLREMVLDLCFAFRLQALAGLEPMNQPAIGDGRHQGKNDDGDNQFQ